MRYVCASDRPKRNKMQSNQIDIEGNIAWGLSNKEKNKIQNRHIIKLEFIYFYIIGTCV